MSSAEPAFENGPVKGTLHIYAAFDWGDETDLEIAQRLVPAEVHTLPRKPRTPLSIGYQPLPLRFELSPISLPLAVLGPSAGRIDVTVFDFGAVSTAVHVPFQTDPKSLVAAASALAEPAAILQEIRSRTGSLFEKLRDSIRNPLFSDLSEEYFAFQFFPETVPEPQTFIEKHSDWLAGLVRLEAEPLSSAEIAEALRMRLSYGRRDLFIPDWSAAVIVDNDCDELLDAISFANLQLLELRNIDSRLDRRLEETYYLIRELAKGSLRFWRRHTRPLRALGELKVEANVMLERSSNTLKLVGDPYLARAYHLLSTRFHLDEWGQNIRRSISVLEGFYQVVSDQASGYRTELLEFIVVLLIVLEIVMAFVRR